MPQGKEFSSSAASSALGLPGKGEGYERKKIISKCPRGRHYAPKTAAAAETQNQSFAAALPQMTRNVEMIAAGRLLANGSALRTAALKKLAEEQLDMQTKASQKKIFDPMAKKHVKGMRGETKAELEELMGLAPELKKQIEKIEKERRAVARKRHAHVSETATDGPLVGEDTVPGVKKPKNLSQDAVEKLRKAVGETLERGDVEDAPVDEGDDIDNVDDTAATDAAGAPPSKRARKEGDGEKGTKVGVYTAVVDDVKPLFANAKPKADAPVAGTKRPRNNGTAAKAAAEMPMF